MNTGINPYLWQVAFWTAFGSLAAAVVLIILTLITMRNAKQIVLRYENINYIYYYDLIFGTGVGPQLGEAALGFLFFTASHLLVTWFQRRKSPLSAASSAYLDVESVLPVTSADSAAAATQPAQVSLHHSSASLLADGLRLLTEYTGAIVLACRRHGCSHVVSACTSASTAPLLPDGRLYVTTEARICRHLRCPVRVACIEGVSGGRPCIVGKETTRRDVACPVALSGQHRLLTLLHTLFHR